MSRALDALLAKHHLDLTSDEVLAELDSAFTAVPGASAAPLSTAEVVFLRDHSGAAAVIDGWSGLTPRPKPKAPQVPPRSLTAEPADVIDYTGILWRVHRTTGENVSPWNVVPHGQAASVPVTDPWQ